MLRALMYILPLALTIYAFIDCLNTPEEETKHLPKVVWVIIILLFWIVGPIVWFAAGKQRRAVRGAAGGSGGWVAPDDNPEFLKSLKEEAAPDEKRAKDESLLKDWEADLRRREEELKRREQGDGAGDARESKDSRDSRDAKDAKDAKDTDG
ncbi:PLD nuclease N-terminal domain-containing protein [Streptomyces showdoensis]|uniref:Membrane protein n=1 Tax=Streptomyces showdoensis TaxID=68268 RepID=A0A2P2GIQ6_STREW|nr:PLD nuclease N-terminal domain-containing protein [Streptomyces showdoensis]KKZ71393.1 membrane protein [Streptomyces showdoensis]